MTFATEAYTTHVSIGERFKSFRVNMAATAKKRQAYRQTMDELQGLTDQDLADLGIHRSMIPAVASGAAYGN